MATLVRPTGLDQIRAVFGNPLLYANSKDRWQKLMLQTKILKCDPVSYAYDPRISISKITAHKLVVGLLTQAIETCVADNLKIVYGGCYAWRAKRSNPSILSTHTWGISVDLDPANNAMGRKWVAGRGMIDSKIVDIFEAAGFEWGGRWRWPDCMHFQYCRGY